MKALTIRQPWATLAVHGIKTVETRSWPAPSKIVGERIAIHAGARRPPGWWSWHGDDDVFRRAPAWALAAKGPWLRYRDRRSSLSS